MRDFTSPTAAILSLEAAVDCRNFPAEASIMLRSTNPQSAQDPEILRQTAEVLELAYRKWFTEGGFPDMRDTHSEFPHQELIGQDLVQVTEVFHRPNGQSVTHLIDVVRSAGGWHVVTLPLPNRT